MASHPAMRGTVPSIQCERTFNLLTASLADKSELVQSSSRDALRHAHRAVHKGGRSVWSTSDHRRSTAGNSGDGRRPWRNFYSVCGLGKYKRKLSWFMRWPNFLITHY